MARDDRMVARALRRHLGADEPLLASAAGCEPDGRRRQVVLLTDRRLLIADVRGGTPTELGVDTTSASYETDRALLILEADGQPVAMVREVQVTAANDHAAAR